MISMLQQFFMVPQFRFLLMRAEDSSPPDMVTYKGEEVDDNMLRQLQLLFANLQESIRDSVNPTAFCYAFKEFDGEPTRIGE